MKYQCDVIRDILPLYKDKVCSEQSKVMVEEHLEECEDCKEVLKRLDNTVYDDMLDQESKSVIGQHMKKQKKATVMAGGIIAGILMIPLIVCLICNLAVGHALNWFFIVMAGLMVAASITVVPLMVEKKRWLWTIISFMISTLLLLMVCCIYTGGSWFAIAGISTLTGITICFLPVILYQLGMKKGKALSCMIVDTALVYALIWVAGSFSGVLNYASVAYPITIVCTVFIWLMFLIIRYLKVNGYTKLGLCVILSSFINLEMNDFVDYLLGAPFKLAFEKANLISWSGMGVIDANIRVITTVALILVGLVFVCYGFMREKEKAEIKNGENTEK